MLSDFQAPPPLERTASTRLRGMARHLDLTYPALLQHFGRHNVHGRTESRAFLGWFLEHYFRLDELHVEDSICDGPDDKGVDGIYVDTTREVVYVFQTKIIQNAAKTVGDSALREFAGTLSQFKSSDRIKLLAQSTGNVELRKLLESEDVAAKIASDYELRGVWITNAKLDTNGERFRRDHGQIDIYDRVRLEADWLPLGDTDSIHEEAIFHLDGLGHIEYRTPLATAYIASLRGSELVKLAGIESQGLFAWNVRQSLGRTKVNKAIAENVGSVDEHKNFMLYHNGLTILASDVVLDDDGEVLRMNRYSVVNGAQSLTTLYERRAMITNELRVLARVVNLDPDTDLARMITRNSNNQNAIGARDLQSNSTIQKRLKEDFKRKFGSNFGYEIKRGEQVDAQVIITNEEAARILLAFDLEQPWACHQSYRYFDDLHAEIFGRPVVTAARIVGLVAVRDSVVEGLKSLDNKLVARYSVTPFFVIYLVRSALELDEVGREFCKDPGKFVSEKGFQAVRTAVSVVIDDLIVDLNAEIRERADQGAPFDHKRELKSVTAVRQLRGDIMPGYQKALNRNRASSFSEEWTGFVGSEPLEQSSWRT